MSTIRGAPLVISASSAKTTSSTAAFTMNADSGLFLLNVTASSSPTTLDMYLQTSPNSGTTWYDFAHFTQVGAVSTSIQALTWTRKAPVATGDVSVIVTGDAALAVTKVINAPICGNYCRAKYVIAGTSYTFSLTLIYDKD